MIDDFGETGREVRDIPRERAGKSEIPFVSVPTPIS